MEKNGGYGDEGVLWHQHSNRLLIELMKYFPKEVPVVDLGCGHNWYCNTLRYFGYETLGLDSVKLSGVDWCVDITEKGFCEYILSHPQINFKTANVISLEVGEHIPEALAGAYLDNVCSFGGDVVMSWAVPGQEGIGHINCRSNEWVVVEMNRRGYKLDTHRSAALRLAVMDCHCTWFRETVMYFVKGADN